MILWCKKSIVYENQNETFGITLFGNFDTIIIKYAVFQTFQHFFW